MTPRWAAALLCAGVMMTGCLATPSVEDLAQSGPAAVPSFDALHEHSVDQGVREAHVRIWNTDGALLLTSWAGEVGAYDSEEIESERGPVAWPTHASPRRPAPLYHGLLPMLAKAPPHSVIQVVGHRVPDTLLGQYSIPKHIDVPRIGTLPKDLASISFGEVAEGDELYYLGKLPVTITSVNETHVGYRLEIAEPHTFDVPRQVGLQVQAWPSEEGAVRFSLVVPESGFIAHANCAVQDKLLPYGYYVAAAESAETIVLDRYGSRAEYLLRNSTVTLEVTFLAERLSPDGHDHTH